MYHILHIGDIYDKRYIIYIYNTALEEYPHNRKWRLKIELDHFYLEDMVL